MSLAYIILAHRLPAQLARMVSTLYHPDDLFLIHVDAKVRSAPFRAALRQNPGLVSNIEFVKPVRCDWAGFGHLKATLRGIDQVLSRPTATTHISLLTGQDYPIKPLRQIRTHFEANSGRSFISSSAGASPSSAPDREGNRRWYWDGNLSRLQLRHYLVGRRWVSVPNRFTRFVPVRPMPLGMRPYQGLAYWSLSMEAVRYVQQRVADSPDLIRFFHRVFVPDEFFFQTVLLNSPLIDALSNEDLRYMTWEGYHPAIIRSSNLDELSRSPKLFARKFDPNIDPEILDRIDGTLLL